jgi:hypothetical protein
MLDVRHLCKTTIFLCAVLVAIESFARVPFTRPMRGRRFSCNTNTLTTAAIARGVNTAARGLNNYG